MRHIHIVGRRNHGKTALIADLLGEFCRRGIRAGSIKHSAHDHELDVPGKDSYRHREAGANPAAIIARNVMAVFVSRSSGDDCYLRLEPLFADCELVLVEGDIEAIGPKVEVWRAAMGTSCLAAERRDIRALVSDDRPEANVPVWPRAELGPLADRLLALARGLDS